MNHRSVFAWIMAVLVMDAAWIVPAPVAAAPCAGVNHFETINVLADATPVSGARVVLYTDAARQTVADNLQVLGQNDAVITTGSDGAAVFAVAAGTYYVRIVAKNQQTYEPSVIVPADGTCGYANFSLTQSGQLGVSLEQTTVSVSPASIAADGVQAAVVTMQVRNEVGSVLPNQVVDLQSNLSGMFITHNSTSTDQTGRATFTVRATIPGNAQLYPYVNSQLVKPILLTVTSAAGAGSAGTSAVVSPTASAISASPSIVAADGVASSQIIVIVRDANSAPVAGVLVSPRTTLAGSVFAPATMMTDANGKATFVMTSPVSGLATVTAIAGTIGLADRPNVQFGMTQGSGSSTSTSGAGGAVGHQGVSVPPFVPASSLRGELIKLEDDGNPKTTSDSTVYYVGNDNARHAFPDERTYFTWYADFQQVTLVSAATMASIPLGSNVTARPGARMVKFPSDPKVYAVEQKRTLRWVTSGTIAQELFGADWAKQVNDVSEAFATSYVYGADIVSAADYSAAGEMTRSPNIQSVLGN